MVLIEYPNLQQTTTVIMLVTSTFKLISNSVLLINCIYLVDRHDNTSFHSRCPKNICIVHRNDDWIYEKWRNCKKETLIFDTLKLNRKSPFIGVTHVFFPIKIPDIKRKCVTTHTLRLTLSFCCWMHISVSNECAYHFALLPMSRMRHRERVRHKICRSSVVQRRFVFVHTSIILAIWNQTEKSYKWCDFIW